VYVHAHGLKKTDAVLQEIPMLEEDVLDENSGSTQVKPLLCVFDEIGATASTKTEAAGKS
jgi:hypothetical protein